MNYGSFLGGCTLREYAMGWTPGEPSPGERETMDRVLREAMADGAFGVATALIYPPNAYSTDAELLDTCRVLAETGKSTSRTCAPSRTASRRFFTIDLGRRTGVPVEIYPKATGRRNWDKIPPAIEMIDEARAEGAEVAANMYPYDAAAPGSRRRSAVAAGRPPAREPPRPRGQREDPSRAPRSIAGMEPLATLAGPGGVLVGALPARRIASTRTAAWTRSPRIVARTGPTA